MKVYILFEYVSNRLSVYRGKKRITYKENIFGVKNRFRVLIYLKIKLVIRVIQNNYFIVFGNNILKDKSLEKKTLKRFVLKG